ncbi:galactosylceramide sulfotransferase-like [Lytechinus pictus]|uniref:galactosylceramide sulfotransferase-like n=1 Tax=Lytechinus pictus TaxID=7653 RepID=UPI0030B9CA41
MGLSLFSSTEARRQLRRNVSGILLIVTLSVTVIVLECQTERRSFDEFPRRYNPDPRHEQLMGDHKPMIPDPMIREPIIQIAPKPIVQKRFLEPTSFPSTPDIPEPSTDCEVHTHVVYIKTHKTGSTTLETLFNRFGYFHNLSFIFNGKQKYGHFEAMDLRKADMLEQLLPPLGVETGDYARYKNYETSAIHVRFYRDVFDRFMAKDTRYVSSVRDPADQWESAFNHFGFRKAISQLADANGQMVNITKTHKVPFNENNSTLDAIHEFLRKPKLYLEVLKKKGKVIYHFANNDQTYDLSTDLESTQLHDEKLVNRTIDRLVDELDVVIVNEYFDESLLVMKKEFCWEFTDILYISQNKRAVKEMLPEKTRAKIRDFNRADTLLHQRFNDSLWKKIEAYGPDFQKDLNHYRQMLIDVNSECSAEGKSKKHGFNYQIYNVKAKKNATLFCRFMADNFLMTFRRVFERQRNQTIIKTRKIKQ